MRQPISITHEFVESFPGHLEPMKLYVSIEYGSAAHLCFCGCGAKVVTPISPTGWKLIYDRDTVSLLPSIGSWNLPCQSHYFITRNRVEWALQMTKSEIEKNRSSDRMVRERYYGANQRPAEADRIHAEVPPRKKSFWSWLIGQ
jgi:hypothetical protein